MLAGGITLIGAEVVFVADENSHAGFLLIVD